MNNDNLKNILLYFIANSEMKNDYEKAIVKEAISLACGKATDDRQEAPTPEEIAASIEAYERERNSDWGKAASAWANGQKEAPALTDEEMVQALIPLCGPKFADNIVGLQSVLFRAVIAAHEAKRATP